MWMTETSAINPGDVIWVHPSFYRVKSIHYISEGIYEDRWEIIRTDGMRHIQKGSYTFLKLEDVRYDHGF